MNIDEYMKHANYRVGVFCERIGINPALIFRYRKRQLRPSFHHARRLIHFSNGLIAYEDLGWKENGEKIPWTQKELRTSLKTDGKEIQIDGPTYPVDTPAPLRK